jgi:hypothetical protein
MSDVLIDNARSSGWKALAASGWRANYWLRLELALILSPTFVYFVLADYDGSLHYLRLLIYTLLVGNCAAILPGVVRRLYQRRKAPWDRVIFYLLVLVGIDIPDIVTAFIAGMRAAISSHGEYVRPTPEVLMFHLPSVFGELSSQDRLVAALLGVLTGA